MISLHRLNLEAKGEKEFNIGRTTPKMSMASAAISLVFLIGNCFIARYRLTTLCAFISS